MFRFAQHDIGIMGSKQVEQWKDEDPNEVDKVPEKSADLDTVRQMLGIALVKPFAHRQPHINEYHHAPKHMQAM
jgi:hypothetical protein